MNFPSIDIQGSILSTDLLAKIRSEQAGYQHGKDFNSGLTDAKLKDEISAAWQEAKGQWNIFKSKLTRLKESESGTTETRNFWIAPLLTNLGYNLTFSRASEELNGKTFPISYRDGSMDNFPVYIGGYHESLDKRPENKQLRVSPHAMLQEYLNYSGHLYGMVTNGRQLRLLRDASRITRLSYVEFNLEKMMEEDLYSDFVIFYRVMHASRMPQKIDAGAESIIEKYHQEALEAGSTIRSKLGFAVKGAIQSLANGFINHPDNAELRKVVADEKLDADEFYRHLLRIIYRLLFLFVIEERNLVYANSKTAETKRFSRIYFHYFSLMRLRKLARNLLPPEANRHHDLWQGLMSTFSLFEKKEVGEKLGIMALQGDLFGYEAISNNQYDLHQCQLSNAVLLHIIKSLSYFENDNGVLIAVNYGGLDVEEFGSVYEGLLELKLDIKKIEATEQYRCSFHSSSERSKSGSHYTPEELVQPLIKHSLDYLIADRLKEKNPEAALLSLKVADVACGSGHILLSAARRIAHELACLVETRESGSKQKVEQPSPTSVRKAMKDVVRNCIYGVDKNPLAVELCKIALWLEAYNPGEPLNFLDHHIKCGDAIVGLAHRSELENGIADEAFKILPGDDKEIAAAFRKRNQQERKQKGQIALNYDAAIAEEVNAVIEKFNLFKNLPENTPEEVERKTKEHAKYEQDYHRIRLKQLADTQIAQFFIPKTEANKDNLMTDAEYRSLLRQVNKHLGVLQSNKIAKAQAIAGKDNKNFFHWFLEFPEVFAFSKNPELAEGSGGAGGFDCILGNPPFLGGKRISGAYGDDYLNLLKRNYQPSNGGLDLVTYFFRRIFEVIKIEGYQSLISTNTIAQGDSRIGGLEYILCNGGTINFAVKNMKWPGMAAVDVSLISIIKGQFQKEKVLNNNKVPIITSFLDDSETISNIYQLEKNALKCFQGSVILGKGFILSHQEALDLIHSNKDNNKVIFSYLNGDDVVSLAIPNPSRFVINFFDWSEKECSENFPECYDLLSKKVKPERIILKDKGYREKWWQYGRRGVELYKAAADLKKVLVGSRVTKNVVFEFIKTGIVFSDATVVAVSDSFFMFSFLNSNFHEIFSWKYSSTMGGTTLRYTPSVCFETFPFPQNLTPQQEQQLETIGATYHERRRQLMLGMQLGLTKTYNQFHNSQLRLPAVAGIKPARLGGNQEWSRLLEVLDNGAKLAEVDLKQYQFNKESMNLIKHFIKGEPTITLRQAVEGIEKLRELHVQMDEAVLDAYGWSPHLTSPERGGINLRHDFYEVDYLPENDRVRFTIHPDARKEVLKRLLELNHKIHEEEVKAGLWDKKGKSQNAKSKSQSSKVNEPQAGYGRDLFNQGE